MWCETKKEYLLSIYSRILKLYLHFSKTGFTILVEQDNLRIKSYTVVLYASFFHKKFFFKVTHLILQTSL